MKVLPEDEFRELARRQGFSNPERALGFIDKEVGEPVVLEGAKTRIKLHELGHEEYEHFPKSTRFYGKGRDVTKMTEPWRQRVDDEIEAEIYSYEMMGKRLTPRIGIQALYQLLGLGWTPYRALSLVIGRLRHYGIETSYEDRMDLVHILQEGYREEFEEWKGW